MMYISFLLFLSVCSSLCQAQKVQIEVGNNAKNDGSTARSTETFVPSSEWQTVKPGQMVPKGLHIRMNLQTGVKEAKLLDRDDAAQPTPSEVLAIVQPEDQSSLRIDEEELKQILDNMKGNKDFTKQSQVEQRSYEELKMDFEALNLGVKSDSQIMTELYKEYMQSSEDKRKLEILADLEYHVHQIDNGLNFVTMGGIRDIVKPGLNSSSEEIRASSAYLLGSCSQSNPKVQIAAYEAGAIHILVKLVAIDDSVEVKNKALYALAVLCRNFPIAQSQLVKTGALSSFSKLLRQQDPKLSKVQVKIIALLYDLILEPELTKQQLATFSSHNETELTSAEILQERLKQYTLSNVKHNLLQNNWCPTVSSFLARIYATSVNSKEMDHDTVEKVLYFMSLLSTECRSSFNVSKLIVKSFMNRYSSLELEDGDEYFSKIVKLCNVILSQL